MRKSKNLKKLIISYICFSLFLFITYPGLLLASRLKDLAAIEGIRTNQLIGYGLVVGLDGTGDKAGTKFTIQSLVNMMERMGVHVDANKVKVKNVAAVVVTASLSPFVNHGSKIDVTISSIGDAKSLMGGTLLMTPLKGVDGKVYAIAQGALVVGGYSAGGEAGGSVKNHLAVARITKGAIVEREIKVSLDGKEFLTMNLFNPDFTTAIRVSNVINAKMGIDVAKAVDSGTVQLNIPTNLQNSITKFLADIESLKVVPDTVAKIVVNEKTGTVVIGKNVRISTVAVAHGNLSISIKESQEVSQPKAFATGKTVVTVDTEIGVDEDKAKVIVLPNGNTIGELVRALNAIGVTPRDLISIFQSIKVAGALQAELEII